MGQTTLTTPSTCKLINNSITQWSIGNLYSSCNTADFDANTNAYADIDVDVDDNADVDANANADANADADADADVNVDFDFDVHANADANANINTDVDANADAYADPKTNTSHSISRVSLTQKALTHESKDLFSFTSVRNPWTRLISAWVDKFQESDAFLRDCSVMHRWPRFAK